METAASGQATAHHVHGALTLSSRYAQPRARASRRTSAGDSHTLDALAATVNMGVVGVVGVGVRGG